jgi:hypothetical protein
MVAHPVDIDKRNIGGGGIPTGTVVLKVAADLFQGCFFFPESSKFAAV